MIENEEYLGLDRRNSEKILINICRTFLFLHLMTQNDSSIMEIITPQPPKAHDDVIKLLICTKEQS